jgi:hypothetical protein
MSKQSVTAFNQRDNYPSKKHKRGISGSSGESTLLRDELTRKIGENLSVLKGGRVMQVRRPNLSSKAEVEVDYKFGTKIYTILGTYSQKTGEFLIKTVRDGTNKNPIAADL